MDSQNMNGSVSFPSGGFPEVTQRLIDDATKAILILALKYSIVPALATLGVITNTLNILVFVKMDISDGVNLSFLVLSISDGLITATTLTSTICLILTDTVFLYEGKYRLVSSSVVWIASIAVWYFQYVSMVTTVVITVVRCLCVAIPLKVKQYITPIRQLTAIIFLSIIGAIVYAATYFEAYIYPFRTGPNETNYIIRGHNVRLSQTFRNVVYNSGVVVVVICVAILTTNLRRSSNFRRATTVKAQNEKPIEKSAENTNESRDKAKKRDLQVAKVVNVIAIVFISCYIPQIALSVIGQFLDTFPPFGKYSNFNQILVMINEIAVLVNAGINLVFYLSFNSRYKETFQKLYTRVKK